MRSDACPQCGGALGGQAAREGLTACPHCGVRLTGDGPGGTYAPAIPAAGLARPRIGELLVEEGLITPRQLKEALEEQQTKGGKTAEILIRLRYLDPHALVNFLARQPGVASIDLQHYVVPGELIEVIPKELAIKHEVFPVDRLGRLLTLAMAFPLDRQAIEELEEATGLRIKALLCSRSDLRAAISSYYPCSETVQDSPEQSAPERAKALQSAARLRSAAHLIHRLRTLPALPETVFRMRQAMGDIETSVRDAAELIASDPPMAAKVLSVANSAAYGFPQQVKTIELAVSLLGLRETYAIVTSAAVINLFDDNKRFDYRGFWANAMASAAVARLVADRVKDRAVPGAVAGALLHDIGRIAMLETAPNIYAGVPPHLDADELLAAEQRLLGLTHTEAGYELALHWQFPVDIAEAIRFHHRPEQASAHPATAAAVAVAVTLAQADAGADAVAALTPQLAMLGLDSAAANALLDEIRLSGLACRWWAERWDKIRRGRRFE